MQKSFEVQVSFEAPNDEIATEMANDMIQDDDFDFGDGEEIGIESVTFDSMADGDKDARVDRSVKRWCESWWKDLVWAEICEKRQQIRDREEETDELDTRQAYDD